VRFLTLAEALVIAEAVTGTGTRTLQSAARIELLDSALHAPQAGSGDEDFHPLPDGNERLAWTATVTFLALNEIELSAEPDDAVAFMLAVAVGTIDVQHATAWIEMHAKPPSP